jgi:folate-binding protein YgfZ
MITDLRVHARPDALLIDVPSGLAGELAGRLDQLIFAEDVQVADASAGFGLITVTGGDAARVAARVSVEPILAARVDDLTLPVFDLWVPSAARDPLMRELTEAGVAPISPELFEAMRIEAGRPRFGVDMTTDTIPLEAGLLDRAISTSKGCYVGQEVIIRVLHRGGGRVARRLVKLAFEPVPADFPLAGAAILSGGRETGRLTSVARSATGERGIALGYVRREVADAGGTVEIETGAGRLEASIVGLAG